MTKKKKRVSKKTNTLKLVCIIVFAVFSILAFASMFMPFRTVTGLGSTSSVSSVEFLQNVDSYREAVSSETLNKVFAGAVMQVIVASICAVLFIGAMLSILMKKQQKMINKINAVCAVISVLFVVIAIIVANNGMAGFNIGIAYKYGLGAGLYVLLSSLVVMSGSAFIVGKK